MVAEEGYEEQLTINKSLTLAAQDGATITGSITIGNVSAVTTGVTVSGFTVNAASPGTPVIHIINSANVSILNNTVNATEGTHQLSIGTSTGPARVTGTVSGNEVYGAIGLGTEGSLTVTDNIVKNASAEGIWFYPVGAGAELVITGNTIENCGSLVSGSSQIMVESKPTSVNDLTDDSDIIDSLESSNAGATVKLSWAKYISSDAELIAAIDTQADGQTWIIAGKSSAYDLPRRPEDVSGQPGWYFPITVNNLTIIGVGNPVLSSSAYAPNAALASQNLITVWGNNVTFMGLTIEPKVEVNKSVEVIGNDFTITECTFRPNTLVTGDIADPTGGGSLYFSGEKGKVLVENNTFNNTSVVFDNAYAGTTPDVVIADNTWDSISGYAIGNVFWGTDPYTDPYVDVTITGNSFNSVTDTTKIITARMNQTLTLDGTNTINGSPIDANDFCKYINFNNLPKWELCKDNKVVVDGVTYESPFKDVDTYITDLAQLQAAIDDAETGDTILLGAGDFTASSTINVNKAVTILGFPGLSSVITTSGTSGVFVISAAATLDGIYINKTDKTGQQHFITLTSDGATIENCKFTGQFVDGDDEVVRAIAPNAGISGYTISGCHFENIRQPAYLEGPGTVTNNFVKGTRGWVVCVNHAITFTGNSFEDNAVDIAIIANGQTTSENYTDVAAISAANNGAYVQNQLLETEARNGALIP